MGRFLQFDGVSFAYPGMTGPLLENVSAMFPEGKWTGIVGANGAGKTTLLRLAAGTLKPSSGVVRTIGKAAYAAQRTDSPPTEWDDFMNVWDADAIEMRRRLGVLDEWADPDPAAKGTGPGRWDSLSHGERKRVEIAIALWKRPDVLALDEPTNHLDAAAKRVLLEALRGFRGAGLLVSHDREFLDALASQCLFVFPPHATMRPGGVSAGEAEDRREQDRAREEHESAAGKARRLRAAAQERREEAERSAARTKRVKERKAPMHDSDGRFKRNLAKLTGKDGWGFTQSSALNKRAAGLEAPNRTIRVEYEKGVTLEGTERSRRDRLARLPAGSIELDGGIVIRHPELVIRPDDRIALTGPNGAGKSSLLARLMPFVEIPEERMLVVPQEISEEESRRIHESLKRLEPEPLGRVMTLVSRLGSRPGRLLASTTPSPGEIRKILLARGVDRGPWLIVMDEPTNHLDLPGIECLEEALAEASCALLLVSHDERFLARLAKTRWRLEPTGGGVAELSVAPFEPEALGK